MGKLRSMKRLDPVRRRDPSSLLPRGAHARLSARTACIAAVVLLLGHGGSGAEHNKDIREFAFSSTETSTCTGDQIAWSGTFQIVDQFTANPHVITFHTTTTFEDVRGVDLVTGDQMHWTEASSATDGFILDGQEFRDVSTLRERWIDPGRGQDQIVTGYFVVIIDENGIERVSRGSFEVTCA